MRAAGVLLAIEINEIPRDFFSRSRRFGPVLLSFKYRALRGRFTPQLSIRL